MQIVGELRLDIDEVYPTESILSINPERITRIKNELSSDGSNTEVFVFKFKGDYYIVQGHHEFLAAAGLGINNIRVYLVDYNQLSFFSKPSNIEHTLASIGRSTLYDFELIGDFKYKHYPSLYK